VEWIIFGTLFQPALRRAKERMYRGQDFPTCQIGDMEEPAAVRGKDAATATGCQKLTALRIRRSAAE